MSSTTRFEVVHRTEYRYGRAMTDGYSIAHLLVRDTAHQQVESSDVMVEPDADERTEYLDAFGNRVLRLGLHRPHDHLVVTSRSVVQVRVPELPADDASPPWDDVAERVRQSTGDIACDVAPFAALTAATPALDELADLTATVFVPGRPVVATVRELATTIFAGFHFDADFSDVSTPIADVLRARRGVCQDFAHVMLACLRAHGLAARYVSGYIETLPPPGQPKLAGPDATHAWCSVWVPQLGWVDVDPTNDQLPPQRHITVGWGRDYFDVTPLRGVVIGPSAGQTLQVGVDVRALD